MTDFDRFEVVGRFFVCFFLEGGGFNTALFYVVPLSTSSRLKKRGKRKREIGQTSKKKTKNHKPHSGHTASIVRSYPAIFRIKYPQPYQW